MLEVDLNKLEVLAAPLILFTEKYLGESDKIPDILLEDVNSLKTVLVAVEKLLPVVRQMEISATTEDVLINIWSFKELILKALIILNIIDRFYLLLQEAGYAERSEMLHNRLVVEFTNKALESPEVVEALNKGTLDEELEKRKEKITTSQKSIRELENKVKIYNKKPDFFEQIPMDL